MKTDVIFLGAGASVPAGFPDNRELANFIIEGLEVGYNEQAIRSIAENLRRTNMLSVDEFCWKTKSTTAVQLLKRIARYALAVYSRRKGKLAWNSPYNPYRNFIDTLFPEGEAFPNGRFTIVNFNYDGLLSKLLRDAVESRADNEGIRGQFDPWKLAAVGGGYYHFFPGNSVKAYDLTIEKLHGSFMHLTPHGTITVLGNDTGTELYGEEPYVYPDGLAADSDIWQRGWSYKPMIDFPWEPDETREQRRAQLKLAASAVQEASRIHFIGIAGHHLMHHSLRPIFEGLTPDQLVRKKWFIATKESDPERTFWEICNCFLPPEALKRRRWRQVALKAEMCGDLERWIYLKPHHPPSD